jgi:uncharacterized membrane protein (DUF485 family)
MAETVAAYPRPSSDFLRDLTIVFVAIVLLSAIVSEGTVFSYLAILFASALRNLYFGWLGDGVLFYVVVGIGLFVEALVLTGLYHAVRRVLL